LGFHQDVVVISRVWGTVYLETRACLDVSSTPAFMSVSLMTPELRKP
jgi:hypothetical protein